MSTPKKESGSAKKLFDKLGPAGRSTHVLTGMVRRVEADDESIEFTQAGDCLNWKKIPACLVEDIKFINIVHCDDHTHPLVHLFMKEPETPEGRAFAALAQLRFAPAQNWAPAQEIDESFVYSDIDTTAQHYYSPYASDGWARRNARGAATTPPRRRPPRPDNCGRYASGLPIPCCWYGDHWGPC